MFETINNIHFFFINSNNIDNFELYTDLFEKYNLDFTIIDNDESYIIKQETLEEKKELIKTNSHIKAIQKAYIKNYKCIVVVEDFVDISPLIKYFKIFKNMCNKLLKKNKKKFRCVNLLNINQNQNRISFNNFISFNLYSSNYNKNCNDSKLIFYTREGIEEIYNNNIHNNIVTLDDKKKEKLNHCHKAGYYIHSQLNSFISNFPFGIPFKKNSYEEKKFMHIYNFLNNFELNFRFIFLITLSNNAEFIERNINIIKKQSYKNWKIIFINDCCTDNTIDIIKKQKNLNYEIIETPFKSYEGYSRYLAYNRLIDTDICVMINGDDSLQNSNVLNVLNETYKTGVNVTYGSFRTYNGRNYEDSTWIQRYGEKIDETYNYRSEKTWYGSHLRTYKAKLIKKLNILDLLDEYFNFFPLNTDRIESICCLEQSNQYTVIDEILYKLNTKSKNLLDHNDNIVKKMNEMILDNIKSREKYDIKSNVEMKKLLLINIQDKNWREHIAQYKYLYQYKYDVLLIPFDKFNKYASKINKYNNSYFIEDSKVKDISFGINRLNNIDITRIFDINYKKYKNNKGYDNYMDFYKYLFKIYLSQQTELSEEMKDTMLDYKVQSGFMLQDQREKRMFSLF